MWSQVPQSPLRAKTAAALFWDLLKPVREKRWTGAQEHTCVHSWQCTIRILFKCRIPHTRKTNKVHYGWTRSTMCSMSPATCQQQTENPKHQICSSSQVFQEMLISTILLRTQQVRAVHQHQRFSQWSYPGPSLGEGGGHRKGKKVVTGFFQWKEAPSESNSSNPS